MNNALQMLRSCDTFRNVDCHHWSDRESSALRKERICLTDKIRLQESQCAPHPHEVSFQMEMTTFSTTVTAQLDENPLVSGGASNRSRHPELSFIVKRIRRYLGSYCAQAESEG
jgi:hypothetical protein